MRLSAQRAVQGNPKLPQRIEGVKAIKVYYNPMPKLTRALPAIAPIFSVAFLAATAFAFAQQQPPPIQAAALQSHEGMTVSAKPWLDATLYKQPFPKKSPFAAGVLAVQVTFRNDSDESVKVGLDRIRLTLRVDEDNRQELKPMTAEQVAEATLRPHAKDPTAHRRFPISLPSSGVKSPRDKNWTEIQLQAQNAAVPTSVVAAHSTVQGLLYFDLQGQLDMLTSAHLYVPDIAIMGKSQSLTYFEIDLSRPAS